MMIPGRTLHRLAACLCSEKALERVVEPALADFQKEYGGTDQVVRRAWVLCAGYFAILKLIAICAVTISITTGKERHALVRTLAWSVALIVVVAVLLMLPPLYGLYHASKGWYAAATLVPQAVPLAIPIGVAFGLALGVPDRTGMNTLKVLMFGALAASLLSFAVLAWAMPAGNQAFREITFRELKARGYDGTVTLQKAYNEMTFTELRREIARVSAEGEPRRARQFAFSFHLRFSLAAATLALVSVLLAMRAKHRGMRTLIALAACLAYWMVLYVGDMANQRGYLTPSIGAWLPNLVLVATPIVIASLRSSRPRGSLSSAQ